MSAREFRLPDLGEGLTEAEIIAWHVAVGDHVSVDQVVCEVETAKASVEVPCPYEGEVVELHGAVGDVVDVGKPLISIAGVGAVAAAAAAAAPEEPADRARLDAEARNGKAKQSSGNVLVGYGTAETGGVRRRRVVSGFGGHGAAPRVHVAPVAVPVNGSGPSGPSGGSGSGSSGAGASRDAAAERKNSSGVRIAVVSPLVRRLAKEGGLDLASVQGSGPEGLIMRRDVEAALAAPAPAPALSSTGIAERERVPLRGLRKTVADKLSRSRREIPDATTWVDVDATGLLELRAALNRDTSARKISLLAVLARICVAGLARYPELNATVDVERQEIVRYSDVNLGFAAQTDRGLVVPVVHGAHRMSTEELAAEFERLTTAARAGSLPVSDLTGSTFTLNNYGVYGVDGSTPILNHPEAAMLGVGRIAKKPWVVDDALAVRSVTQLSFTFDHRVCDGGVAGGFLRYVADLVEEPARLLRGL